MHSYINAILIIRRAVHCAYYAEDGDCDAAQLRLYVFYVKSLLGSYGMNRLDLCITDTYMCCTDQCLCEALCFYLRLIMNRFKYTKCLVKRLMSTSVFPSCTFAVSEYFFSIFVCNCAVSFKNIKLLFSTALPINLFFRCV